MFTRVKVQNYKSLVDLEVDLSQKKNEPKPIILIYGENGVGKSNFASVFYTLNESLQTMSIKHALQQLMDKNKDGKDISDELLLKVVSKNLRDTESIIKNCKTIDSEGNMILEFDFNIKGRTGNYLIEYSNTKIVHEKLDYVLNKNKTNLYDISSDKIYINDKIFQDNEYCKEFKNLLEKYIGKHSVLSILSYEIEDKADGYIQSKIHEYLYEVIASFLTMSIKVKSGNNGYRGKIGISHKMLSKLTKGSISISDEKELDCAEEMINEFFTLAYSDIKEAYYKREIRDEKIEYTLIFRKLIYGKVIDVDSEFESTGTLNLINILPFLLMCVEGRTIVIDEIDAGIHDLLISNLLTNIINSIQGQLIITTHNTMLLDTDIDPAFIYTFMVDADANKTLSPITLYEDRTHPNLNYRRRYLKGMYGGIPICQDIDFDELREFLD